jgi:hypothetical protein
MQDGWKSIRKVFIMAATLDIVYQLIVLRAIRPLETLLVASVLAIFPYLLLRGPINRIARRRKFGNWTNPASQIRNPKS